MKTWRFADILTFLKNSAIAGLQGELLLRLNVGRYIVHILYCFFLIVITIWISLMIDVSLSKMENNSQIIKELKIEQAYKVYEVASAEKRSTVEATLEAMGSEIKEPEKPAIIIKER